VTVPVYGLRDECQKCRARSLRFGLGHARAKCREKQRGNGDPSNVHGQFALAQRYTSSDQWSVE